MTRRPAPRATYRLQLGPSLDFAAARRLVPYLAELGISHLYLSPVLQARAGSTHGYDVVDPSRVSEELGGEEGLRSLCSAGLEVILDIVPNHMAAVEANPYWRDPARRRRYFDLDERTGLHRRFFDVDELAGVRVEDAGVFEETHRLVLRLAAEGLVDGVRVDHVDGLADPRGYLERLRAGGLERVWVEKILEPGESLRDWPVEGTTGYEFAGDVQALFVDPAGEAALTDLAGEPRAFAEVAHAAKLELVRTTFRPETERLRALLDPPGLEQALAALPVYRTYVEPATGRVEEADRAALASLPAELASLLLLEGEPRAGGGEVRAEFVTRFQQTTGAVMAKGVEDTAFYRYVRLLALNEVGGDPGRFGLGVEAFHRANLERQERFPRSLLTGTTHDTKRSADVRARIGALAGMAERWSDLVRRWHRLNEGLRSGEGPDPTEELLLYQTLVGAWPISPERLVEYVAKAAHEEKRHTSWVEPDRRFDTALAAFCRAVCEHEPFLAELVPFVEELAPLGLRSAVGQLVLRLTAPGVPDIYGGDELTYLALVDPDNRRPIDWRRRQEALAALPAGPPRDRETIKLWTLHRALAVRRRRPEAFEGAYEPLRAAAGTCAFRRGDDVVVAVAVRGTVPEFEAPAGAWRDALEGIGDVLDGYSPRLLERVAPGKSAEFRPSPSIE